MLSGNFREFHCFMVFTTPSAAVICLLTWRAHMSCSSFLFSFSLPGISSHIFIICITLFFTFLTHHCSNVPHRLIVISSARRTLHLHHNPVFHNKRGDPATLNVVTHKHSLSRTLCLSLRYTHTRTRTHTAIEPQQCQIDHPVGCPPARSLFYYPITAAV